MTVSMASRLYFLLLPLLLYHVEAFVLVGRGSSNSSTVQCKTAPGDAFWPSAAAWAKLNASTGGRLLHPSPPGAVCHPEQPTYNATLCPTVQAAWGFYPLHNANPISVGGNEFTNDSCLPWTNYTCSAEGYPVYVINATCAEHVKLGVDFAREYNIRLIVKASGHDFIGRSVAPNSLSIWTRYMTGTTIQMDGFQPTGCNASTRVNGSTVTALGGTQMGELQNVTGIVNLTVVGGGSTTVSIGGYLTGGGHSLLSSTYGLATDQVVEMEIVSPQGEILTLNECQNEDLFWAMRGGGGSTFGILTSATMKTYPSPPLVFGTLLVGTLASNPSQFDAIAYFFSQFPALGDAGLTGYSYVYRDVPDPRGGNASVTLIEGDFVLLHTQNTSALPALLQPVLDHVNASWPAAWLAQWSAGPAAFPSFGAWWALAKDADNEAGMDLLVGSRLLDAPALAGNLTAAARAWDVFAGAGYATAYLVAGKGTRDVVPAGGSDAVLPAWRSAYVHATNAVVWTPQNATDRAMKTSLINSWIQGMRDLAPDTGAYMNEAYPYEANWQETFWGSNYPRLLSIKRTVDPDDVLWCSPCVGNERWEEVGDQLCRV